MKDDIQKAALLRSYYGALNYDIALQDLENIEADLLVSIIENICPLTTEGA